MADEGSRGQTDVYFYGVGGQRQGVYRWNTVNANGNIWFYLMGLEPVIPKGLQMNRDRLGSVMYSAGARYYPYGEEAPVTAQDRDKFGTYHRDSGTGLGYAEQRYYAAGLGRFLTADPYLASGGTAEPGSWNRYGYTRGDPTNRIDKWGLADCPASTSTSVTVCDVPPPDLPPSSLRDGIGEKEREGLSNGPGPVLTQGSGAGGVITVYNPNRIGENQKAIDAALLSLSALIDPTCRRWIETGVVQDFEEYVSSLMTYGLIGHGDISTTAPNQYINAVAGADTPGFAIVINDNGAFFNASLPVAGGRQSITTNNGRISGNTIEARIFILLHEIGHANRIPGFLNDANDINASRRNNDMVQRNCDKTLKRFR